MNSTIDKAQYLIRRELWENKGSVIWTPVVISAVLCLLFILSVMLGRVVVDDSLPVDQIFGWMERHGLNEDQDQPVKIVDFNQGSLVISTEKTLGIGSVGANITPERTMMGMQHGTVIAFEVIALFVAFVYLLGALFNDRKDRSILFWKSLPISETSNVLNKMLFAITVIPFVALVMSIPVQLVGGVAIAWGYSLSNNFEFSQVFSELSLLQVFFIHAVLLIFIGIKSFPLYAWLLLSSSVSKRSPLLIAVVVPIFIIAVEQLIFDTSFFLDFVGGLFFSDRFNAGWLEPENAFHGALALMSFSLTQVLKIVLVSALFLTGAIWCRNNRYEI